MFSEGIIELLKHVITSWQVIAVTVGIIIYLNIVFYVARSYRTPKLGSMVKKISFKRKPKAEKENPGSSDDSLPGGNANDELGLEED